MGPCTPPVLRIACNFSAVPLGLRHNLTVSNSLRIEVFLVMLKEQVHFVTSVITLVARPVLFFSMQPHHVAEDRIHSGVALGRNARWTEYAGDLIGVKLFISHCSNDI